MSNQNDRQKRITKIFNSVIECGESGCDKEKIVALMGIEMGIARRTTLEYIKMLIYAERIILKEGMLYANSDPV